MGWPILLLIGIILAGLVSLLYKISHKLCLGVISLYSLIIFIWGLRKWELISLDNLPEIFRLNWIPSLGIQFSFLLDGPSLFFVLIISGIGFFIFLYSMGYFGKFPMGGRYSLTLLLFMISMLGLVTASDLILMFVFWELTGFTSFLLIGHHFKMDHAREQAKKALFVTGMGDLFLLVGIIFIYQEFGSFDLHDMLRAGVNFSSSPNYKLMVGGLLIGAFTKSAQFPFHFWLNRAMVAPTPISAFLHSATMVKAGVYLIYRMGPLLGGTPLWSNTLIMVGIVTFLLGAALSLFQNDLKLLLAYTTISSLGTMVYLAGIGSPLSISAGLIYIQAHALFKSSLFMIAGAIDHLKGTRDIRKLFNLKKSYPLLFIAAISSALSMGGFPPFMGYHAKHSIYESGLQLINHSVILFSMAILASILTVCVSLKFLSPFIKTKPHSQPGNPHSPSFFLWFPPLFLAGLTLFLGIGPGQIPQKFLSPVLFALTGETIAHPFKLWHGFDFIFYLGGFTYIFGITFFFLKIIIPQKIRAFDSEKLIGPENLYHQILKKTVWLAKFQTKIIQGGDFWKYLFTIVVVTGFLVGNLIFKANLVYDWTQPEFHFLDLVAVFLISASGLLALKVTSRLGAVLASSGVGLGITFIYCLYSAPDLAMTQILVEALTLVLLALVIRKLPLYSPHLNLTRKLLAIFASGLISIVLMVITLQALSVHFHPSISYYFAENSYLKAFGKNVVNVILVDFRGLDTMGEITVLGLAGLGVFSLTKIGKKRKIGMKKKPKERIN